MLSSTSVCSKCRNQSVKCHVYDQSLIVLCRLLFFFWSFSFSFCHGVCLLSSTFVCSKCRTNLSNVTLMINFLVVFFRLVFVFLSFFWKFLSCRLSFTLFRISLADWLADSLTQYILFDTNRKNTLFLIYKFHENNVWHDIYNYCVLMNNLVTKYKVNVKYQFLPLQINITLIAVFFQTCRQQKCVSVRQCCISKLYILCSKANVLFLDLKIKMTVY